MRHQPDSTYSYRARRWPPTWPNRRFLTSQAQGLWSRSSVPVVGALES